MTKKRKIMLTCGAAALIGFILWTIAVLTLDRAPVGPLDSSVGFSRINSAVHTALGVSEGWYDLSEILGFALLAIAAGFALYGGIQLIRRRSFRQVDPHLYLLAGLYVALGLVYVGFEMVVINFRPILIDGVLEAAYPSSHTMLALCIAASAAIRLRSVLPKTPGRIAAAGLALVGILTVIARLLSGMHWLSDIVGAVLISAALVLFYAAADLELSARLHENEKE